jgi:hypothetical protein
MRVSDIFTAKTPQTRRFLRQKAKGKGQKEKICFLLLPFYFLLLPYFLRVSGGEKS